MRHIRAVAVAGTFAGFISAVPQAAAQDAPTFSKDVLPILQAHCQTCHRPGEIGPMPLLTFEQVRPYARAIRAATEARVMPPWFADSSVQHYRNDRSLPPEDIATIGAWVDGGAREGDPADAPAPRTFATGWNIVPAGQEPDLVIQMPEPYQIPSTGTVEYTYIIIPTGFTEDTWVTAAEIRPEARAQMHHAVLYLRTPGSPWLHEYPKGVPFVPQPRNGRDARSSDGDRTSEGSLADEWLVGYVPGGAPYTLPDDTAFLVKAGSDFVLQLHYTTNGSPVSDRTRIGLNLADAPPARRAFIALVSDQSFTIPPNDPAFSATATTTLARGVEILSASPHMHLRGKAMDVQAVLPDGRSETLFDVPRYDFNWQQMYELAEPISAPAGTRLVVNGVFNNSASNRFNPDPSVPVRWGDQSWEEMLLGIITFTIEPDADVNTLFERRGPPRGRRGGGPAAPR